MSSCQGSFNEWLFDNWHNDTIFDTHMWSIGKFNGALNLNGSTDYLNIDSSPVFLTSIYWTVIEWINPSLNITQVLMSKRSSGSGWSISTDSTGKLNVCIDGWSSYSSNLTIDLNVWQLWAFVFDGSKLTYYKNGIAAGSTSILSDQLPSNSYPLQIGASVSDSLFFKGEIDDVRIYNRTTSAHDLATMYVMGPYAEPNPIDFNKYYNFTDDSSNNTMLLYAYTTSKSSTWVVCTNFFGDNCLSFQANSSTIVNIWTNLGRPEYISNGFGILKIIPQL
jgi:hypothetical protein